MLTNSDLQSVRKELCRRSLAEFCKQAWQVIEPATPLHWGWALDLMCSHLEAVTEGKIRRLLINVPPGMMKSLLVNTLWPAWEWGPKGMPEMRYLSTAHKEGLAIRDSTRCRRLIQSDWYQSMWPIDLTGDQNAKTKFENQSLGFREAMAFTSLTGSRGDRVLLDDPHSVDGASSEAKLSAAVETFREALPSRVSNSNSAIVIIMQRLHESDISSEAKNLNYHHLCLPMRYEEGRSATVFGEDPRTEDGELLFPERFDEKSVRELELSLGDYATAGQLQQRPAPRQGGMIKPRNIDVIDALPAKVQWVRGWDLAASKNAGDWTVGAKLGVKDGVIYIADLVRERGGPDEVEKLIVNTAKADNCKQSIPQDPGAAGKSQAAYLSKQLQGIAFKFSPETGDKATRADPFAAQVNIGNVKMLRADWNETLVHELRSFPGSGAHDDIVDALSRAYNEFVSGSSYTLANI